MTLARTAAPRTAEPVVCHRCGVALHGWAARPPTCKRCWLAQRLERGLDDGTGQINPALQPLGGGLVETPRPDSGRMWLSRPYVVELLAALATGREPLTHDTLTGWPRQIAARHLRHR